jgi:hypothetical protein
MINSIINFYGKILFMDEKEFNTKLEEIKNNPFNKILIEEIFVNLKFDSFVNAEVKDHRAMGFSEILKNAKKNYNDNGNMLVNVSKQIIENSVNVINENNLLETKKDLLKNLFLEKYEDFKNADKNEKIKILIEKLSTISIPHMHEINSTLMLGIDYVDTFFEENILFFFSKNIEEYNINEKKLLDFKK